MDKNKKKSKTKNNATVFGVFLMLALFCLPFIFGISAVVMLLSGKYGYAGILGIAAAAAFALMEAYIRFDDRRSASIKQEYREQYVSELKVNDPELGELTFEYDSHTCELAMIRGVPALFGDNELEVIAEDDGEKDTALMIECLKRVMKDKDKIIKGMFDTVREVYENEGITEDDEEGVPTDDDYIMRHMNIYCVYCSKTNEGGLSFTVAGGMHCNIVDHISEHGLTAVFSSDSDEYEFYSG